RTMMSIPIRVLSRTGLAFASATLFACASGGSTAPRPVHTSVRVEPQAGAPTGPIGVNDPEPGAAPSLPRTPGPNAPARSSAPERRISTLDVPAGTPISVAVSELGAKLGWSVSIDPAVRGTTQASLKNVTIDAALQELVTRNGYAYQLQGTVLRVVPVRME